MKLNLLLSWSNMPWDDTNDTICYATNFKIQEQFVMQKFSKIMLFLWKDFGQNFMLVEGLWSIPCLSTARKLTQKLRWSLKGRLPWNIKTTSEIEMTLRKKTFCSPKILLADRNHFFLCLALAEFDQVPSAIWYKLV